MNLSRRGLLGVVPLGIASLADAGPVRALLGQGTTVGHGIGTRKCAGWIDRYEFTVPAQGRDSFVAGPAEVQAEAVVLDHGTPVDTQTWTRKVTVSVTP